MQNKKSFLNKIISLDGGEEFANPFLNLENENPKTQETAESDWGEFVEGEGQLAVDVYETEEALTVKSTIAGAKPEDIEISVNNDMLTIRGKREAEERVEKENYFYQECYWGNFSRSIILPKPIDINKITAQFKNGVLTIILPKIKTAETKITVKEIEE
ncbi:MAG: Hsp20/alpha crystallin family protein [Patescibacteria group bacterium]|nr:Hsp20/alpha crystallin family protein [Patescibacteria group bacterium]MDD5490874.1 Hsp20/alpha crystallin family protein [Patescibacteria group bacterium]